jgi:chromosome segregation ATPase
VLYLAEIRKQSKGFIGGSKTELKLLACQHNDQTWSAVPGEEVVATEEIQHAGDGALVLVKLSNNRQIQGKPELAGIELVRQLQKLSRLLEKTKDQQEEIDQWKQSLSIQSEELTRRQMEMESRLEQIDQMQGEFEELERQRQEMEANWSRFEQEQQRLEELQQKIGPIDWNAEGIDKVKDIIGRLFSNSDRANSFQEQLQSVQEEIDRQQNLLSGYLQQLEHERENLGQQQNNVSQQSEAIKVSKQGLELITASIETNKIQLQVKEQLLGSKQELSDRINLELDSCEELKKIVTGSGDTHSKQQINIQALENMPLGELQEITKNLQADFEKIVRFVNDQEEELALIYDTVEELEAKIKTANDYDRFGIETELAEEQERKKMFDETLFGQRRRLKERQSVLAEHLRVLRRRQGVIDIEDNLQQINLEPILLQIKERKRIAQQDRLKIDKEIEELQQNIQQLRAEITQQESEKAAKIMDLQQQEENCEQAKISLAECQARIKLYEEALQPLQGNLAETRQKLQGVVELFV